MSENERARRALRDQWDEMDHWRDYQDRRQEERDQAKAEMRAEQERRECNIAEAGAHAQIAELKQRLEAVERQLASFDELASAVATFGTAVDSKLAELQQLLTRHSELRQAELPEAKRAAFQFAREKSDGEIVDLPDFIRKMH
jgi:hypothetical protein